MTAVLMSGALIAFAMIAVDVGSLYDEHRQLRNGADAAALAVAQSCVKSLATGSTTVSTPTCRSGTDATSTAGKMASANADDGSTVVERLCGSAPLATCPTAGQNASQLSACTTSVTSAHYVQVQVRTGTSDGRNVLDPAFGPKDEVVRSCARAAYGSPSAMLSGLPITISKCLLVDYRNTKGGFAPAPPYQPDATSFKSWETVIQFHQAGGNCATTSSGANAPGNFGYLDDTGDGPCKAYTEVGTTVGGDTGNGNPSTKGCTDKYLGSLLDTVVYLPVFDPDKTTGTGTNVEYQIIGYLALYFTGWNLTSTSHASTVSGSVPCRSPVTCISGYFASGLLPTQGPLDPDLTHYFGVSVANLVP